MAMTSKHFVISYIIIIIIIIIIMVMVMMEKPEVLDNTAFWIKEGKKCFI